MFGDSANCVGREGLAGLRPPSIPLRKGRAVDND